MTASGQDRVRNEVPAPVPPRTGLKVRAHPALCEGWGNCHRWAPDVYPLDDEGQIDIHLLEVPPELAEAAWMGAQVCPAKAISVLGERPAPPTAETYPTRATHPGPERSATRGATS